MSSRARTLADMIEVSTPLATRFFAGFNDDNRAAQLPNLPNHFAWTIGHCALTMHRVAPLLDGAPLPERDFEEGVEHAGGSPPTRFGTEGVAFGSKPVGVAERYPAASVCVGIFERACARLSRAAANADDAQLDQMHPWGAGQLRLADMLIRVNVHNAMHAGQLVDLRRGLGLARVIG